MDTVQKLKVYWYQSYEAVQSHAYAETRRADNEKSRADRYVRRIQNAHENARMLLPNRYYAGVDEIFDRIMNE